MWKKMDLSLFRWRCCQNVVDFLRIPTHRKTSNLQTQRLGEWCFVWFKYPDWKLPLLLPAFTKKRSPACTLLPGKWLFRACWMFPTETIAWKEISQHPCVEKCTWHFLGFQQHKLAGRLQWCFLHSSWSKGGNSCESLLVIHVWEFSNRESNITLSLHITHTPICKCFEHTICIMMMIHQFQQSIVDVWFVSLREWLPAVAARSVSRYHPPTPDLRQRLLNAAGRVTGQLLDLSMWDLQTVDPGFQWPLQTYVVVWTNPFNLKNMWPSNWIISPCR